MPGTLAEALVADEVGIVYAPFGPYRLKAAFQPILAREGERMLRTVAVRGFCVPTLAGEPSEPERLFAALSGPERRLAEAVAVALPVLNQPNLGADGLDVLVDWPASLGADMPLAIMAEDHGGLVEPSRLVWCLAGGEEPAGEQRPLVSALRGLGSRIGVVAGLSDGRLLDAIEGFGPGLVSLDARPWQPPGLESRLTPLLAALVAALQLEGLAAMISGIETPAQLEAALESGADLFCGPLLALPALAGTLIEEEPRPIAGFLLRAQEEARGRG